MNNYSEKRGYKIGIIGAGSWGTALGILLSKNGNDVVVWSRSQEKCNMINRMKENIDQLPGVLIPEGVYCTTDMEEAARDADLVLLVSPSQMTRQYSRLLAGYIRSDAVIVSCEKGLEEGTEKRLSEVIAEEIPGVRIAVLSGPSHAEQVARDVPTTVTAASVDQKTAEFVQDVFMSPKFRVYTNPDIIGVELGGALKNVIAICAGISDGLGFGDNTKAALITRGITEISRLGVKLGAKPQTFAGLSGIGDLIVTCTSMDSRNRRAGFLIGQGMSVEEAIREVRMVVEGYRTTAVAYGMARRLNVSMPITVEAYKVLYEGKDPKRAVADLMMRTRTHEVEELANIFWNEN